MSKGIEYLLQHVPGGKGEAQAEYHYFYGNYYATQATFMAGGDASATYWPAIRGELLKKQQSDGCWNGEAGPYATAMALIILQVPKSAAADSPE